MLLSPVQFFRYCSAVSYSLATLSHPGMTAVLVEGPYREQLNSGRGLRGSDNQRVIVQRFPERYRDAEHMERQVQFIGEGDHLVQIGIPPLEP